MMSHQLPQLDKFPNLIHSFSTREDDNMSFRCDDTLAASRNRQRFLTSIGVKPASVVTATLLHGDGIAHVTRANANHGVLTDDYHLNAAALISLSA